MPAAVRNTKTATDSRILKAVIAALKHMISRGDTSVVAISERCGVYRQTTYGWLRDGRTPPIDKVEILAQITGHRLTLVKQ